MKKFILNNSQLFLFCLTLIIPISSNGQVRCYTENITMPSYLLGPQEKHPVFKDYRLPETNVFRSKRLIYPYTVEDEFTRKCEDITYEAVCLENKYIKVLVMPELRGRLQAGIDKRNGWDFLYYNHVIKPADIAIRQAWISGGIEWNHPQGHGYTQFEKISYKIIDEPDGGKTILVAEVEPNRMHKWEMAITLRPDRLFVETHGRFISIEPFSVPFLSSQNSAEHIDESSEVIYPKGTWATGHGKNNFVKWPVNKNGVDLSWYKNIRSPFSAFADGPGAKEDYFGCYSHAKKAGTVIVADHRTAPGKKFFTWGSHPGGKVWNHLLTDKDGAYIELQLVAFWDNLGYGYNWINPMEVKEFTAYWYPIMNMGGFVKANKNVCLNLRKTGKGVELALQATMEIPNAMIEVKAGEKNILKKKVNLKLNKPNKTDFLLPGDVDYKDLKVEIYNSNGGKLLSYETAPCETVRPEPPPVEKKMSEMTLDELYQKGKSYYQDPFCPEAEIYYKEMLKHDPGESRAHRALGVLYYYHGYFEKAKKHLNKSLGSDPLNEGNLAHLYLGLCDLETGDIYSAKEELKISTRYVSTKVNALYNLGRIELMENNYEKAVSTLRKAIENGGTHPGIWSTLAIAYRKLDSKKQALMAIQEATKRDPLDFTVLTERWFWNEAGDNEVNSIFDRKDSTFVGSQLYLRQAANYMEMNELQDAIDVLQLAVAHFQGKWRVNPLIDYYLGYCYEQLGKDKDALYHYKKASEGNSQYVFPYRKLSVKVFQSALSRNESDSNGWLYLGNVLTYLRQHEKGLEAWKKAENLDPANPLILSNLAHAYWYLHADTTQTIGYLEKAFSYAPNDAHIFYELDCMNEFMGRTLERINSFNKNRKFAEKYDYLVYRWITLLLSLGEKAIFQDNYSNARNYFLDATQLVDKTYFFPREMNVHVYERYAEAHLGLGETLLKERKSEQAIEQFKMGLKYPGNLNEGSPANPVRTRTHYLLGLAYKDMGNERESLKYFNLAANGPTRPNSVSIYYQSLALELLGKTSIARNKLQKLANNFSKSLKEKDSAIQHFELSQAYRGLGEAIQAKKHLKIALEEDPNVILETRIKAKSIPWDSGIW